MLPPAGASSGEDAQDLNQEFFARLIKGHWLAQADQERGRFRSFLLLARQRFMANEWHKARTQKRGGGVPLLSLDEAAADHRYQLEPADKSTPESLFERRWALTLLDGVLTRLEEEYRREGKSEWFEVMQPALTLDRGAINYASLAEKLGLAGSAARVAVHRLRQRYREVLRDEVANTVVSPGEVEEEMRHLFRVLSGESMS